MRQQPKLLKKFREGSSSSCFRHQTILGWPAISWSDHHDGVTLDTMDHHDHHTNYGEIRQHLDTWARVWRVRGQASLHLHRVSKSCNHAITRLPKIFENLRNFLTNERETGKNGTNFMYLSQFDKVFLVSCVFM